MKKWHLFNEVYKSFSSTTGDPLPDSVHQYIKFGEGAFDCVSLMCRTNPNQDNDAKLIASAPELLEALKQCHYWMKDNVQDYEMGSIRPMVENVLKEAGETV